MAAVALATHRLTSNSHGCGTRDPATGHEHEEEPDGRSLLRQGQEEGRSPERPEDHHEERQARAAGDLPRVWREGLPDRRLTPASDVTPGTRPPPTAGASSVPAESADAPP